MISDVDEIIRGSELARIVKLIDKQDRNIVFGDFEFYKFFLNRKVPLEWTISVATSWKNLSKYIRSVQSFRAVCGFAKGHAFNGFYVLESVKKRYCQKLWMKG